MILEGEYDRLHRLKKQQEKAEKERKLRAEAKGAAQRAEEARAEEVDSKGVEDAVESVSLREAIG